MMTGNTAIHIASQLQSGAPRKAAFLVAVHPIEQAFAKIKHWMRIAQKRTVEDVWRRAGKT